MFFVMRDSLVGHGELFCASKKGRELHVDVSKPFSVWEGRADEIDNYSFVKKGLVWVELPSFGPKI